jgi:hypothetical protein
MLILAGNFQHQKKEVQPVKKLTIDPQKCGVAAALTAGVAAIGAGAVTLAPSAVAAVPFEYADKTPPQLVQLSAERTVQGTVGTLQALKPLHEAFKNGDDATVAYIVGNINDAPQWTIDPAIEAAAQVLPKPVGGTNGDPYTNDGDGKLMEFRNTTMLQVRDTSRKNVLDGAAKAGDIRDKINAGKVEHKAKRDAVKAKVKEAVTKLKAKSGDKD